MKHKSIKLLLWAIFMLLLALYLLLLNLRSVFWDILSLGLMGTAIVFAIGSWIVAYISDDDDK